MVGRLQTPQWVRYAVAPHRNMRRDEWILLVFLAMSISTVRLAAMPEMGSKAHNSSCVQKYTVSLNGECFGSLSRFWTETVSLPAATCHDDRARRVAMMLRSKIETKEPLRVLDLGSGCGSLRKYLRQQDVYIPSDIVSRKFPVVRCDYNRGLFPRISNVSVVVALGVLEYMCDISNFLESVASYGVPTVVSYSTKSPKYISLANQMDLIKLEDEMRAAGLVVIDRRHFDVRFNAIAIPQVLYLAVPERRRDPLPIRFRHRDSGAALLRSDA